uniref:Uncharacterized protein n=1 Tax=Molossus molossus TaxID=27622 RepID=A0A7J8DC59_MOLMO|nr:hypothetical protein HJG59_009416 [Molossus molossus]
MWEHAMFRGDASPVPPGHGAVRRHPGRVTAACVSEQQVPENRTRAWAEPGPCSQACPAPRKALCMEDSPEYLHGLQRLSAFIQKCTEILHHLLQHKTRITGREGRKLQSAINTKDGSPSGRGGPRRARAPGLSSGGAAGAENPQDLVLLCRIQRIKLRSVSHSDYQIPHLQNPQSFSTQHQSGCMSGTDGRKFTGDKRRGRGRVFLSSLMRKLESGAKSPDVTQTRPSQRFPSSNLGRLMTVSAHKGPFFRLQTSGTTTSTQRVPLTGLRAGKPPCDSSRIPGDMSDRGRLPISSPSRVPLNLPLDTGTQRRSRAGTCWDPPFPGPLPGHRQTHSTEHVRSGHRTSDPL